ncbi:MAG: phospholipase D-like domain-containing protein, partial [Gemmataceae bacterium]
MRRTLSLLLLMIVGFLGCDGAKPLSIPGPGAKSSDGQTGSVRVYFTTPELPPEQSQIVQALVSYIGQTKETLDVAAFELDNKKVVEALEEAVRRGVKVRLVTETNYLDEIGVTAMKKLGVPVVDDQRDGAL